MSEVIDARPDIKFLKDHNLMNDLLITDLITQRTSFVQKSTKNEFTEEECLKLLKFEVIVMDVCKEEIDKNDIPDDPYSCETKLIINAVSNRIDHLYYCMFQKFSMDCDLLSEYMEFQLKNEAFITNGNPQLIVLMTNKICEPDMYITAATFEYENQNIEKARQFFDEGIKKFPLDETLYVEQIWIESLHLEDTSGESDERAIQIYNNIKENVEMNMEFYFDLLYRSIETKSIWRLQYHIICDLMEKYKQSDVMWSRVAELCSEGYIFEHDISFFGYTTQFKFRASACIETYVEGIKNLTSMKKKRNLMKLLAHYIINVWKSNNGMRNMEIHYLVRRKMDKAFQIGHFELGGLHKPEFYVYWAEIIGRKRPEIVQLAIDLNKNDVEVWLKVMEYHILNFEDDYVSVKNILEDGNRSLENKSLPLWEMMETFLHNKGDLDLITQFYRLAANSPYEEVNMVFRLDCLSWCYVYNDIFATRVMFKKLSRMAPECKKLYMYMIHCELCEVMVDVKRVQTLYSLACSKFGHQVDDTSLWIDCIEFELAHARERHAKIIYEAALMLVKPELRDDLESDYRSMVEEYRKSNVYNLPAELSDEEE